MNMTLGEMIDTLSRKNPEFPVYYEFCMLGVCGLSSYRGYYDHLAIGFTTEGDGLNVRQLLNRLEVAVGAVFDGYKGGKYTMTRQTPMWAANYGQSGSTAIADIRDTGWCILLKTEYVP